MNLSKMLASDPALADMVSRSMCHALRIFGLGLGASKTEQKVRCRQMARVYHPDMHNGTTRLTSVEMADFFKLHLWNHGGSITVLQEICEESQEARVQDQPMGASLTS
jgi:hypothetical protein